MKFLDLDSPVMVFLGKMADLMWLNILTLICCIPVITAGASLTAMHYMALKILRNEECYITRSFFKSFKANFKQATLIWLILLGIIFVLVSDFYIIFKGEMEMPQFVLVGLLSITIMLVFVMTYIFPVLAKFENTIRGTFKNAFIMSFLQFPKTVLMIVFNILPAVILLFTYKVVPFIFLFGLSVPAIGCAWLYNSFFKKLEAQMTQGTEEAVSEEDDERIFKDELEENITAEQ